MKLLNVVTYLLILIGGLNWGLVGFFDYDLVVGLLGDSTTPALITYNVIGVSALYRIIFWKKIAGCCCCGCKK